MNNEDAIIRIVHGLLASGAYTEKDVGTSSFGSRLYSPGLVRDAREILLVIKSAVRSLNWENRKKRCNKKADAC